MISRCADWVSARVGDEIIMMNVERGLYIGLTETGARIWDLLAEPSEQEQLCARLGQEYDVPAALCRAEVDTFLREMEKRGAVVINAPSA